MKNTSEIIKAIIVAAAILVVGFQLVALGKEFVRNQAIDGCAAQSSYQVTFMESDGRQATTREPQKYLMDKCLFEKGIILEPAE